MQMFSIIKKNLKKQFKNLIKLIISDRNVKLFVKNKFRKLDFNSNDFRNINWSIPKLSC